ncbi:hypothetical protein ID866_11635, partial [Astraeus odoratus]
MAARVGTCANASLLGAQPLGVRESWTSDLWARMGKVQLSSTFMASMIVGEWVNMGEAEPCATGFLNIPRDAEVPRALVRDMYTKSWSAFDRLVAIVPPGGSIGLDDKLFSFWLVQADSYPLSHVKGIYRLETGIKVHEFRDLRANPRCLLESQVPSFRVRWSRMISTGFLGSNVNRNRGNVQTPSPIPAALASSRNRPTSRAASLGLWLDPYDFSPLPIRALVTGAAANFPSVANLVG